MPLSVVAYTELMLFMAALTTYINYVRDVKNRDNLFYQIAVFVLTFLIYMAFLGIERNILSMCLVIAPEANEI